MKDKFCVSKTLTYLLLLVAAVVGTFYATNYANSQKLTSESQASVSCVEKGIKGIYASRINYKGGCNGSGWSLSSAMKTTYHNYAAADIKNSAGKITSACCIPDRKPTTVPGSVVSCRSVAGIWYRTTSATPAGRITACSDLGKGYSNAPSTVTEKVTGSLCCVTTRLPTLTSGGKTCDQQGGDWYRNKYFNSCTDVRASFTAVTNTTDQSAWRDFKCCKDIRLPTPNN